MENSFSPNFLVFNSFFIYLRCFHRVLVSFPLRFFLSISAVTYDISFLVLLIRLSIKSSHLGFLSFCHPSLRFTFLSITKLHAIASEYNRQFRSQRHTAGSWDGSRVVASSAILFNFFRWKISDFFLENVSRCPFSQFPSSCLMQFYVSKAFCLIS